MTTTDAVSPRHRLRPVGWATASVVLLGVALLAGITIGPAELAPVSILRALLDWVPGIGTDLTERQLKILWQLRVPRVALGAIVGGTLATAGAAYQGVFRNPLADPYFLGVSAGAGLGATIVIAANVAPLGPATVPVFAFIGATGAVFFTWTLGRSAGGRAGATIILAGVAVSAFLSAGQTFVQLRNVESIRDVYGFLIGQLNTAGWTDVLVVAPFAALAVGGIIASRRLLDVLAVGDVEATALGLSTNRVRLTIVLLATLGTAAVVSVSGLIGFVGIVVPHTLRLLVGSSYRLLVPLSFVLGAAFLVIADIAARTVLSPAELPIGVVTAFVGGPFFLVILRNSRRTLL
ncbi:MAG: iron complex transport system permease protein [Nitriliruptoraceae bacterium]|jgi:iron complex transport system permease protein